MKLAVLAALEQRTALRYTMPGMTAPETTSYIAHHLNLIGRPDQLFTDARLLRLACRSSVLVFPVIVRMMTSSVLANAVVRSASSVAGARAAVERTCFDQVGQFSRLGAGEEVLAAAVGENVADGVPVL
jgi:hypothetical protein